MAEFFGFGHHHFGSSASSTSQIANAAVTSLATTTAAATNAASTAASNLMATSSSFCPPLPSPEVDTVPIAGDLTFTHLAGFISGIAAIVTVAAVTLLMWLHAAHLSRSAEQLRIVRMINLMPVYALVSFGAVCLRLDAIYLQPWVNVFEAIAIISFFRLVLAFLDADTVADEGPGPYPATQSLPYPRNDALGYNGPAAAEPMAYQGGYSQNGEPMPYSQGGDPTPYASSDPFLQKSAGKKPISTKKTRFMVSQYLFVAVVVAIATSILQAIGHYCGNSISPKYGHFWMLVIRVISVVAAVMSVIKFTMPLRARLPHRSLVMKLFGFKAIIILNALQTIIFGIISNSAHVTDKISYVDFLVSIPSTLLCLETVIFAFAFFYIYNFSSYKRAGKYSGGPLGIVGILQAMNPILVFKDVFGPVRD